MTSPSVSINPAQQTTFAGTFFVSSDGFVQGDAQDDPNNRYNLRKGIVSTSVSQPMWGGLAISELLASGTGGVGATAPAGDLQSILAVGANLTAGTAGCVTGFTVLNQATAMFQSAQSRVPMAPAGGAINFYRLGCGARIPLQALGTAAQAWLSAGYVDPQTIYWDTNNLWLTNTTGSGIIGPFTTLTLDAINVANSQVVSYNGTTNFANWINGACVVVRI